MNTTEGSIAITPVDGQIVLAYVYAGETLKDGTQREPLAQIIGIRPSHVHPEYGQLYTEELLETIPNPTIDAIDEMRAKAAREMKADGGYVTDIRLVRNMILNGHKDFPKMGDYLRPKG